MKKTTGGKNNVYQLSGYNRNSNASNILLAEDDKDMRSLLALMLRKEGYRVTECPDGLSLLDSLSFFFLPEEEHENYDLIISDIRMPGVTGMEMLTGANELDNFPPIILITAFGDEEIHMKAEQLGAVALFDKPFDIDDMIKKVREVLMPPV